MWKFKKWDLKSTNALLKTSGDFYFPDGFDTDRSGVTTKAAFHYKDCLKALPLKVNAK